MLKHVVCLNNGTLTKEIFYKWFLPSKHSLQPPDSYSNAFSNSRYKFADIFEFEVNFTVNTPLPLRDQIPQYDTSIEGNDAHRNVHEY
jgi:hypothetical protein